MQLPLFKLQVLLIHVSYLLLLVLSCCVFIHDALLHILSYFPSIMSSKSLIGSPVAIRLYSLDKMLMTLGVK